MKTCMECGKREKCIEICLYVKRLIPAVEDGRNSEREVLMAPSSLALAADLYSLSEYSGERTRASSPAIDLAALSASERRALLLIAEGMSYAETAKVIGVSRSTVQSYVARARTKFAIQNRHIVGTGKTAGIKPTTGGASMSTRIRHTAEKSVRKPAAEKAAKVSRGRKPSRKPHKTAVSGTGKKAQEQAAAAGAVFEKGSYDPGVIKTGTDINHDGV